MSGEVVRKGWKGLGDWRWQVFGVENITEVELATTRLLYACVLEHERTRSFIGFSMNQETSQVDAGRRGQ